MRYLKKLFKKINSQRLSRIITSREIKSCQDYLVSFYDRLTKRERREIKEMFIKSKQENNFNINPKYKK